MACLVTLLRFRLMLIFSGLASWGKSFHIWLDLPKICVIPVSQLLMFQIVFSTQILFVMFDFTLFANSWDQSEKPSEIKPHLATEK